MSNSDLQRQLNEIQNKLNRIRAENARMVNEIQALGNTAYNSTVSLINTSNNARQALDNNRTVIDYSHNQLQKTFNVQLQIKEMYFIFKDVETANKKIRSLTNKLYFDYRNQVTVRKIVRGFMDNLDLNMVKDETIKKSLEKEFIQQPNYWLAYCLLAIMYWKDNNQQKTEQCLNLAIEKNKKLTSIFFMLFNLKIERVSPAIKWFRMYQECETIGNDNSTFLMLISSLPNRIEDVQTKDELAKIFLEYINQELASDKKDVNDDDINKIIVNYFQHLGKGNNFKYNTIRSYLKEANELSRSLSMAIANNDILKFIEDLNKVHMNEKNIYLAKYIDELVSTPSEDEQKIMDEIHLNEEIISTMEVLKGIDDSVKIGSSYFKELAKANYQKKMDHDYGKLNTINEIVNWVYVNKNNDVNSLTNWNLFALTKDYTEKAYNSYYNTYQNLLPKNYQICVNDYQTTTQFLNLDDEINKKNNFIQNKTNRILATVKDRGAIVSIIFGSILLAAFIALIILSIQFKKQNGMLGIVFIILGVISLLFGAFLLVKGIITKTVLNPKKRVKIKDNMKNESIRLEGIIKKLFEEMNQFKTEYAEADKISAYVKERIAKI